MVAQIFVGIGALIHVYIFAMESILWGKPNVNKTFGISAQEAEQSRIWAFNQGFYNLFLAIAAFVGIVLSVAGDPVIGKTLMAYSALSMFGAAVVLICSNRKMISGFLIQGLAPLLGLIALALM